MNSQIKLSNYVYLEITGNILWFCDRESRIKFPVRLCELSNVPQVKALIDALERSRITLCEDCNSEEYCSSTVTCKEVKTIDNALAPFRMSTGDNEK